MILGCFCVERAFSARMRARFGGEEGDVSVQDGSSRRGIVQLAMVVGAGHVRRVSLRVTPNGYTQSWEGCLSTQACHSKASVPEA